ncbi:MAG: GNAT family N-acetyltransferase [Phycisphaerales bacterium]
MAEVVLREAGPADCDRIAGWIRELAAHEGRPEAATVTGDDLRRWCFGVRRAAEAFVIESGGEDAGYAIVCTTYATFQGKPTLYLEDLFIDPAMRSRGLGAQVMAHLARMAIERECCALDWSAVEGNDGAIAFYRRLGARDVHGICKFRLDGEALRAISDR